MNTAKIFTNIRKNETFLIRTYLVECLVFAVLNVLLFKGFKSFAIDLNMLFLAVPGIMFGLFIASLIHNASHGNVSNKIVNRIVGEFCGAWVLYGFSNFVMIHILHHKHSDTDLDPVNPRGMTFLVFLFAPMRYMIRVAKKWLVISHGEKENYSSLMLAQTIVFHVSLILKFAFWYFLLGPALFVYFYLPSLFANYAVHAHINFICHQDREDGSVEILNLNHNLYYKIINFLTSGGYYHRNHHADLKAYNPMNLRVRA